MWSKMKNFVHLLSFCIDFLDSDPVFSRRQLFFKVPIPVCHRETVMSEHELRAVAHREAQK